MSPPRQSIGEYRPDVTSPHTPYLPQRAPRTSGHTRPLSDLALEHTYYSLANVPPTLCLSSSTSRTPASSFSATPSSSSTSVSACPHDFSLSRPPLLSTSSFSLVASVLPVCVALLAPCPHLRPLSSPLSLFHRPSSRRFLTLVPALWIPSPAGISECFGSLVRAFLLGLSYTQGLLLAPLFPCGAHSPPSPSLPPPRHANHSVTPPAYPFKPSSSSRSPLFLLLSPSSLFIFAFLAFFLTMQTGVSVSSLKRRSSCYSRLARVFQFFRDVLLLTPVELAALYHPRSRLSLNWIFPVSLYFLLRSLALSTYGCQRSRGSSSRPPTMVAALFAPFFTAERIFATRKSGFLCRALRSFLSPPTPFFLLPLHPSCVKVSAGRPFLPP